MDLNEYLKLTQSVVGKGKVVKGGDIEYARYKLDSPSDNYLLGGGMPIGTIVEIFGLEQTTKSLKSLNWAANLQQITGKFVAYIQAGEVGYTTSHAANIGLDTDKVLVINANTAEEALTCIRQCLTTDFCCVILDSVAGLVPSKLTDESKDVGEVHVMGVRARLLSENLPQFSIKCVETGTVLILVNQLRNTNLSGYGNPEGSMGGKGLPYWASIRIKATKKALSADDDDGLNNFNVEFQTVKSKYGRALRRVQQQVDLDVNEEDGSIKTNYNKYVDVVRMAKQFDIIKQAGSWINLSLSNLSEEPIKIQGEANLVQLLKARPEVFEALKEQVNNSII